MKRIEINKKHNSYMIVFDDKIYSLRKDFAYHGFDNMLRADKSNDYFWENELLD